MSVSERDSAAVSTRDPTKTILDDVQVGGPGLALTVAATHASSLDRDKLEEVFIRAVKTVERLRIVEANVAFYKRKADEQGSMVLEMLDHLAGKDGELWAYRDVIRAFLSRLALNDRWPCRECGRPDKDAPLRLNEVKREDGKVHRAGCFFCNIDDLIDSARVALRPEERRPR
jgi:hypothetical protein